METNVSKEKEAAPDNLALWSALEPTNPKYTKPFKGAGGFTGTAINGTYILKRLTETFGPCGQGWKLVLEDERIQEGHTLRSGDRAQLHIVRAHLDYRFHPDDPWFSTSPQFGQTMLVGENKNGTFTDEEAPKKSITDCVSKCAVLLGLAADVHLGMFDDNKYVNQRTQEVIAEARAAEPIKVATGHVGEPMQIATVTVAEGTEPTPPTKDERAWARTVFEQVQGLIKGSTTAADINDALKANKAGLKDLERISPPNFEKLKTYAVTRREELKGELNDPLPDLPDDPHG